MVAVSWMDACGLVVVVTPRTFHLQQTGDRGVQGGVRAEGEGTWLTKEGLRGRVQGRGELGKRFFVFFALLVTLFSLRLRRVTRRGARCYVPINVTALTALCICLFQRKIFDAVI